MEVLVPKERIINLLARLDTSRQIGILEKGQRSITRSEQGQIPVLDLGKVNELITGLRSAVQGSTGTVTLASGADFTVTENGDVVFDHLTLIQTVLSIQKDLIDQARSVPAKLKTLQQNGGAKL